MDDTSSRLQFLLSREAHPGCTGSIELIETHMSWVILAGDRVLKMKKPVRTPWQDLRSVRERLHNAGEELRLNRRLAPDVYLGLQALRSENGRYVLRSQTDAPDDGRTVDWLVCMRRLPADRMLDRAIADGRVSSRDIDGLMSVLLAFYARTERAALDADAYVTRLAQEQRRNRDVLLRPQFKLHQAATLLDAYDAAFADRKHLLQARARGLVDGHGDLRPEHVCLLQPPAIIDALEFSASLRAVDPLDELAYLSLECTVAGAPWIAAHILASAAQAWHGLPWELADVYQAGRALLRARLSAAHLLDAHVRTPQRWLPRARHYLAYAREALARLNAATPHGST